MIIWTCFIHSSYSWVFLDGFYNCSRRWCSKLYRLYNSSCHIVQDWFIISFQWLFQFVKMCYVLFIKGYLIGWENCKAFLTNISQWSVSQWSVGLFLAQQKSTILQLFMSVCHVCLQKDDFLSVYVCMACVCTSPWSELFKWVTRGGMTV